MVQLLIPSSNLQIEITAFLPICHKPSLLVSLKQDGRRGADFMKMYMHPKLSAYSKDQYGINQNL